MHEIEAIRNVQEELNAVDAAEKGNIVKWAERHQVELGPRVTFRAGFKITGFAAFQHLDFLMYRDSKLAQYVTAPYVLEDANGIFTLHEADRGLFRPSWYWKNYRTGRLAGQWVKVTKGRVPRAQGGGRAPLGYHGLDG